MKTHTNLENIVGSADDSIHPTHKPFLGGMGRKIIYGGLALLMAACVPTQARPIIDGTPTAKTQAYTQTSTGTITPESGTPTVEATYLPTETGTLEATVEPTATYTLEPSPTYTLEPTATNTSTQIPNLEGRLYFDTNNSGIQDPNEIGLSGYSVCATECVQTDQEGNFSIPNNTGVSRIHITITNPNPSTTPQMNYITISKGVVVIPAWSWNGVNYPEQLLNNRDIKPIEQGTYIKAGMTNLIGLIEKNLGLCPIDMLTQGVWIANVYSSSHTGLDIAGPFGVSHFSPGNCVIDELYVGSDSGNGMLLRCSDIPLKKIGLHHVDFRYNNYETLAWYGIPIETFFNPDGTFKLNVVGIQPTKNQTLIRGENLHIYMGTTGYNSARIHTHIGAWTSKEGVLIDENDPFEYMACSDK